MNSAHILGAGHKVVCRLSVVTSEGFILVEISLFNSLELPCRKEPCNSYVGRCFIVKI